MQAIHRAARIGQKNTVRVYRLFCRDSMDQRILEVSKKKLTLSYILVKPEASTKDEVDDILLFGSQNIMKLYREQIMRNSMEQLKQQLLSEVGELVFTYSDDDI